MVDFRDKRRRNEIVKEVNELVTEVTEEVIPELITSDNLDEDPICVLLNAMCFKGSSK